MISVWKGCGQSLAGYLLHTHVTIVAIASSSVSVAVECDWLALGKSKASEKKEIIVRRQSVPGRPVVLLVLLVGLLGCSKKDQAPNPEKPATSEPKARTVENESPKPIDLADGISSAEPAASPLVHQFLKQIIRRRQWNAGQSFSALFASWQELVQNNPRNPMMIRFEVDVDQTLEQDTTWTTRSNRQFLDDFCQAHDLLWTITGPDTIRISKKPQ